MIRAPTGRGFPYPRSRRKQWRLFWRQDFRQGENQRHTKRIVLVQLNTHSVLCGKLLAAFPFVGQPRIAAGKEFSMAFFNSAVGVLQTLVIALGAGLGIWGAQFSVSQILIRVGMEICSPLPMLAIWFVVKCAWSRTSDPCYRAGRGPRHLGRYQSA